MPLMKQEIYTLEDIFTLPEGERAELLEGELYMMAPPSTGHQRLVHSISYEIEHYIR
ncbi:MAG: Uma2 family endonuclease, partial [Lachnospiraceae bacterium]|nr:Uma2 family endonuclease [Lachnospiraceae bacterium]